MTHDGFDSWPQRLLVEAEAVAFILIAAVIRSWRWLTR